MSKNIYSESGYTSNQNIQANEITTNEITTGGITIPGSNKGDILIIGDSNSVEGLQLGTTNDILVSNPSSNGLPGYTNAININTVTCNDIKINNVETGDLLLGVTSNYLERLPIGVSGNILTSDGTNPFWQEIILPDPLTIQDLVLTNSLKLSYLNKGFILSDSSGNIYTENALYSTSSSPITFTSSTGLYNIYPNVTTNRNYKVSVSWNNLINSGGSNTYTLNITGQTPITYVTSVASSQENISTAFLASSTGGITIQLVGAHTGGSGGANGTANKIFIICEPLGF